MPGENITAVITSRDITSRKKNEQELSMRSQIIAQANDSIIITDTRNLLELTGHIICNILARRKRETKLEETISELQSFNALMVDRENRMIELKEEINKFLQELGREEKYRV